MFVFVVQQTRKTLSNSDLNSSVLFRTASCGTRGNHSFSAVLVVGTVENCVKDATGESQF